MQLVAQLMDDVSTYARSACYSQAEVAEMFGVSQSRIQQIEQAALYKLRRAVQCEADQRGVTVREFLFGKSTLEKA